jgi:hypothetical protein
MPVAAIPGGEGPFDPSPGPSGLNQIVFSDVDLVVEINEIAPQNRQINHQGKQDQKQDYWSGTIHRAFLLAVAGPQAKLIFLKKYIAFFAPQGRSFGADISDPSAAWRPVPHHQVTK